MFTEHGNQPTFCCDFKIKSLQLNFTDNEQDTETVKLEVWDTAGQERFRKVVSMYYRDSKGVLLCYDITNAESWDSVQYWLKDVEGSVPENCVKILCGVKCDL